MKQKETLILNVIFSTLVVVLVNLLFYFGFFRIDLTKNKIYSLSRSSKKLVSKFDDNILIRAIFSKALPENLKFIRLYVEDLLKEYKSASGGKIKFEFIDPTQPKAKVNESDARSIGIIPVEFTMLEKDKFEVKKGYMGIAMLYKDKKEVIPVISSIETLEYDITSALKRLTIKEKKNIGIMSGHRADTLSDEKYTQIKQQIFKTYNLNTVEISSTNLNNVDGLLIVSPKEDLSNTELFWLDQYILSGKPVVFLQGRYDINLQQFWAIRIYSNIFDLLSNYGIDFEDGLIADYQCQKVSITTRQAFFMMTNIVEYPYMPVITKINKTHPLVKNFQQVVLPFCSALKIKSGLEKVESKVLLESSKYSFIKKDVFSINPLTTDFRMPKDAQKGPFIVAVELKGKFKSYFADDEKFKSLKVFVADRLKETPEGKTSRILIITSSMFGDQEPGLLANIIDYLAQEQDLLEIRSKDITPAPLKVISVTLKVAYRNLVMFLPPALIILAGLGWWYFRKNKVVAI